MKLTTYIQKYRFSEEIHARAERDDNWYMSETSGTRRVFLSPTIKA